MSGARDSPTLVVIGGLPATGKSSVATGYARRTRTPYLRVDRIEQAVVDWSDLTHPVGAVGYAVGYVLAAEQLALGLDVVVECVNPIEATRDAWRDVAAEAGSALVEVELVCSDEVEHRRRTEHRSTDVVGLVKPTWPEVVDRDYHPWTRPHLAIDTAVTGVDEAVTLIETRAAECGGNPVR